MDEIIKARVASLPVPRLMKNKKNDQIVWFLGRTLGVTLTESYNEDGEIELELGHLADDFVPVTDTDMWESYNGSIMLRNADAPVTAKEVGSNVSE